LCLGVACFNFLNFVWKICGIVAYHNKFWAIVSMTKSFMNFLYSYESEFLQKLVKDKKIHQARAFNFTYRYIDDVLSISNSTFAEFLPLIYPPELEVKETTDTASSASFCDLYLEFDDSGQLSTKIYDKRDDFNFKIIIDKKIIDIFNFFIFIHFHYMKMHRL
jgi:hypothetical protein